MARTLVPLKVKIGIKENGQAKYPNFNELSSIQLSNMDWSRYIDVHGTGWHYDQNGHKEIRDDATEWASPHAQQWGVLFVPESFANEAASVFPSECEIITETRAKKFYDDHHAIDFSEENIDEQALKLYETKERMGVTLTAAEQTRKAKAIDPNDSTPGIRKNNKKRWVDFKSHVDIAIKP